MQKAFVSGIKDRGHFDQLCSLTKYGSSVAFLQEEILTDYFYFIRVCFSYDIEIVLFLTERTETEADSIPASISGDRGTHGTTASKHLLSALVVQSLQHNE